MPWPVNGPRAFSSAGQTARRGPAACPDAGWPLFSPNARVEASPAQLQAQDRSMQLWLRSLHVAGTGDFRIAFRLAPPDSADVAGAPADALADGLAEAPASLPVTEPGLEKRPMSVPGPDAWHLHYLFQARSDPSLLLPATEIWRANHPVMKRLSQRLEQPQEQLLAALAYVARLFPPVTRQPQTARPQELTSAPKRRSISCAKPRPCSSRAALACWCRPGGTSAAAGWGCACACGQSGAQGAARSRRGPEF